MKSLKQCDRDEPTEKYHPHLLLPSAPQSVILSFSQLLSCVSLYCFDLPELLPQHRFQLQQSGSKVTLPAQHQMADK